MNEGEERELKFGGVELGALRERLAELDAERAAPSSFEDNWVFDRDGELGGGDHLLRLRLDGRGALVTYKGPTRFEGRVKVRRERQTTVGDAAVMREILEALGFRVARRYQKIREVWRLGGVHVSLDHTPIGDFAEFEGAGGEKVAKRCGLDATKAETRNYLQLYEAWKEDHPEAPPEMVFPEEEA